MYNYPKYGRFCFLHQACEEAKAKMGLAEVEEKPLTVPRPFNLTKPNPRKVPEPMKIEQVKKITQQSYA